jgi:Tfp pilus assembly protein FimT
MIISTATCLVFPAHHHHSQTTTTTTTVRSMQASFRNACIEAVYLRKPASACSVRWTTVAKGRWYSASAVLRANVPGSKVSAINMEEFGGDSIR